MPKGETSRPYNAKQRKALKTLLNIQEGMKGKSTENQIEIIRGNPYQNAQRVLQEEGTNDITRRRMKDIGRKEGASATTKERRKEVKSRAKMETIFSIRGQKK